MKSRIIWIRLTGQTLWYSLTTLCLMGLFLVGFLMSALVFGLIRCASGVQYMVSTQGGRLKHWLSGTRLGRKVTRLLTR